MSLCPLFYPMPMFRTMLSNTTYRITVDLPFGSLVLYRCARLSCRHNKILFRDDGCVGRRSSWSGAFNPSTTTALVVYQATHERTHKKDERTALPLDELVWQSNAAKAVFSQLNDTSSLSSAQPTPQTTPQKKHKSSGDVNANKRLST